MRLRILTFALLLTALVALPVLAGCGTDEETEVNEGEALELGDLTYNVQITRQLNPSSTEDSAYLEGAPPLKEGQEYLAVFMKIDNDGDEAAVVPYPFQIIDTRGNVYTQARVDNDFALIPGTPILPDSTVPGEETAAANGPIEGSMILFPIDEGATENRPLQLEVIGADETGEIELDI
jgi:hypothetical protein